MYKLVLGFRNGKPVYLTYDDGHPRHFEEIQDVFMYLKVMKLYDIAGIVRVGGEIEQTPFKGGVS